ncbi:uncharacterized protein LOC114311757 isoform X1 [Camellia sinensis]|uniref:uncharacterized protein LOC114311757 isoform X1 n=1 Tax=Camellia sinensis TaxID=4442 RepID=UPI001035BE5D|nr:uncharacterized protein LOC114311757 isoform X1 [Camellia sinensis]
MRPNKGGGGGRRRRSYPSPSRDPPFNSSGFEPGPSGSRLSPSRASVLDRGLVTEEDFTVFDNLQIDPNPRSFPYSVKQQCWDKADKVKGRDPDRWRRDNLGNILFRKLVGCPGCLCHDYDHIVPYSKGGKSTLENCQVLQATVNRSKGNRTEISKADLIQKSSYCRVSGRDMDLLELSAYGNVRRGQDSGGCNIQ